MIKLKARLYQLPEFEQFHRLLNNRREFNVSGIYGSFLAVVVNFIREIRHCPQLIVLPDGDAAEKLVDDLNILLPTNQVTYFPSDEVVPFDTGIFTPALYSMRLNALTQVVENRESILVTTPASLLRRTPAPDTIRQNILRLKVGEEFERELLVEWLVESGYERASIIEEIGQFSTRGGIVDIFSFESDAPCRIEYFGDTIESIRRFDVLSQLSIEQVDQIRLLGKSPQAVNNAVLLDYFPADTVIFWEDHTRIHQNLEEWWERATARFPEIRHELSLTSIEEHYLPFPELLTRTRKFQNICHTHIGRKHPEEISFHSVAPAAFHGNIKLLVEHIQRQVLREKRRLYILYEDASVRNRLEDILEEEMGSIPPLQFEDGEFHQGFSLPRHNLEVLTAHEIFNRLRIRRKKKRLRVSASLIRNLQTLSYGDYVVHVDYGVGKYVGTERITVAGMEKECLKLIYANDDVLYVTLDKLNRIQRFVGEEGFEPRLTRLGSVEWERTKDKTRQAVENVARELIELYAKRLAEKGHPFSPDTLWQKEMEASFPFEETPDQHKAVEMVKKDMESPRSMDRLICGDVGYGKTEVAIRAAFKAVMDGKQVAILVPTTILAQQHYNTFSERMINFPVNIDVISRFRSRSEQKQILQRLAEGDVDIIIGTHRLLSEDVSFQDLGLLIIDEEQRFGVRHKEKLRKLKINVDTLTLTATPIPRTLHMSLMGARDLSIVDTPPGNRHPIITEITTWDSQLIYKAITYEMERGGQIFFVHNRVRTIDAVAAMVKNIVPKARVAVAHGQMKERELERIMNDFYHKKYEVLVSTMIIENGLDIPNCNTIIVNRADRFGLAQLYQLRGRVGRSDQQAYAYLIIPPQERLNEMALKRLYAIEEFSDLGSGLKIAMRDLEIRGAGNLLGHRQSGFINAVGYDLYQKILREAVESLQQDTLPEEFLEQRLTPVDASVETDSDTYLPDDYINSPNEKVIIYHRLLNLDSEHTIDNLVRELKDRFGPLPEPAQALIEMVKIKKFASSLYIKQVRIKGDQMTLTFDEKTTASNLFIEKELPRYIKQQITRLKFIQGKDGGQLKAVVTLKGNTPLERLSFAKYFLRNL